MRLGRARRGLAGPAGPLLAAQGDLELGAKAVLAPVLRGLLAAAVLLQHAALGGAEATSVAEVDEHGDLNRKPAG